MPTLNLDVTTSNSFSATSYGVNNTATRVFAPVTSWVTATQNVTNSNTLTNSTELQQTLVAGTYDFETLELIGSTAFGTAGTQSDLNFTGTASFLGTRMRGSAAATEPINVALTWGGTGESVNGVTNSPTSSGLVLRRGRITVTAGGTLVVRFAQSTAVASESARLLPGSYLRTQRVV